MFSFWILFSRELFCFRFFTICYCKHQRENCCLFLITNVVILFSFELLRDAPNAFPTSLFVAYLCFNEP